MKRIGVQEIVRHPLIWKAIHKAVLLQKEAGHEACFLAFWDGREITVNDVAISTSDMQMIAEDEVSRIKGLGFNASGEGQVIFNFHTHSARSLPYPSNADLTYCHKFQQYNRHQWEVDSDVQNWCNPLFGVATPTHSQVGIFQAPPQWVLSEETEMANSVMKAIQKIYEQTYGKRATPGRYWSPHDSPFIAQIKYFPKFLYPQDRQRIKRYQKFLDILGMRFAEIEHAIHSKGAATNWHPLWVST